MTRQPTPDMMEGILSFDPSKIVDASIIPTERLPLEKVNRDGGTQPRSATDPATVADYSDAMRQGASFPPATVFFDGKHYWLADGFHRFLAAQNAGQSYITAEVRQGTQRDAILFSLGANAKHGLRRSNADKRRAVQRMLEDPEWSQWADREIARRCGNVSPTFVATVRHEMDAEKSYLSTFADSTPEPTEPAAPKPVIVQPPAPAPRTVQRGSSTYQMTPPKRTPVADVIDHTRPAPLTVTGTAARPAESNVALNAVLAWIRTVSPSQRMYALSNFKAPPHGANSAPYLKGIPDAAVRTAIKTIKDNPALITMSAVHVAATDPTVDPDEEPEQIVAPLPADLDLDDLRESLIVLFDLPANATNADILTAVVNVKNERDNARHELGRD